MDLQKTNIKYTYAIILLFFLSSILTTTQGFMLSDFIRQYSLVSSSQGLVNASQSIGSIFAVFAILYLAGRIKKTAIIYYACVFIALISLLISTIPIFPLLLTLYCTFGLMFGLVNSTTSSLISDLHKAEDVPKYMGLLHGVFGAGGLLSPLLFLALLNIGMKWNQIFLFIFGISAALLLFYKIKFRKVIPLININNRYVNKKITSADTIEFIKNIKNQLLLLAGFFYGGHQVIMFVWTTRYISKYLNNSTLGAVAISIFWVGTLISRLFIMRIKVDSLKMNIIGNAIAGSAIIVGVLSNSASIMTVCSLLVGLASGMSVPMLLTIGSKINKTNSIIFTTAMLCSIYIAQMLFPILAGLLQNNFSIESGIMISTVCAYLCALFCFVIYRKEKIEKYRINH